MSLSALESQIAELQRMAELKARALARDHKGVALVRATEQHHGIH